jgi:hypothetical protein
VIRPREDKTGGSKKEKKKERKKKTSQPYIVRNR